MSNNPYEYDEAMTKLTAAEEGKELRNQLIQERQEDFYKQFDTELKEEDEAAFGEWMEEAEKRGIRDETSEGNYDYVGQFYRTQSFKKYRPQDGDLDSYYQYQPYFAKPTHPKFEDATSRYGEAGIKKIVEERKQTAEAQYQQLLEQQKAYEALSDKQKELLGLLQKGRELVAQERDVTMSEEDFDLRQGALARQIATAMMYDATDGKYTPSEDMREWNSYVPMATGRERLQQMVNILDSNGEALKNDSAKRFEELLKSGKNEHNALMQIAKENGYFDGTLLSKNVFGAALGYVKYSWKNMLNSDAHRGGLLYAVKQVREEAMANAQQDVARSHAILNWMNISKSMSPEANDLAMRAFKFGGADRLDIGHDAFAKVGLMWTMGDDFNAFMRLSPDDQQKLAVIFSGAREKPEAGVWQFVKDTSYGVMDQALGIVGGVGDFVVRTPVFFCLSKVYGNEAVNNYLRAESLLFNAARPLDADYGTLAGGLKGALEQIPIWATIGMGGRLQKLAQLKNAGKATTFLAKHSSSFVLSSWYASTAREEIVSRGGDWVTATFVAIPVAVAQSVIETAQANLLWGGRITDTQSRIAFAKASKVLGETLAKSGYLSKEYAKALVSVAPDAAAAWLMQTGQEIIEEGLQKFVETFGVELALDPDVMKALNASYKDMLTEMYDTAATMGWSTLMGVGSHIVRGEQYHVALDKYYKANDNFMAQLKTLTSDASRGAEAIGEFVDNEDGSQTFTPKADRLTALKKKWFAAKGAKARMDVLTDAGLDTDLAGTLNARFEMEDVALRRYRAVIDTFSGRFSNAVSEAFTLDEQHLQLFADMVGLSNATFSIDETNNSATLEFDGINGQRETFTIRLAEGGNVAENASQNMAESVWQSIHGDLEQQMTREQFIEKWMTDKSFREALDAKHHFVDNGQGDRRTMRINPGATILTALHENFHRLMRLANEVGLASIDEINAIKERFTDENGEFDEERAADFFASLNSNKEVLSLINKIKTLGEMVIPEGLSKEDAEKLAKQQADTYKAIQEQLRAWGNRATEIDMRLLEAEEAQGVAHTTQEKGFLGTLKMVGRGLLDAFLGYGDYEHRIDPIDVLGEVLDGMTPREIADAARGAIEDEGRFSVIRSPKDVRISINDNAEGAERLAIDGEEYAVLRSAIYERDRQFQSNHRIKPLNWGFAYTANNVYLYNRKDYGEFDIIHGWHLNDEISAEIDEVRRLFNEEIERKRSKRTSKIANGWDALRWVRRAVDSYNSLVDDYGRPIKRDGRMDDLAREHLQGLSKSRSLSTSNADYSEAYSNAKGLKRFSVAVSAEHQAQREYDEVVARYTNRDGSKKTSWMKAPNGKPTNLTERQWVQVRTPSFKRWFGDWEALAELNASTIDDAKTLLKSLMKAHREIRTADGAVLRMVSQSAKAYSKEAEMQSSNKEAHWSALNNIETLIGRSRLLYEEAPRNGSVDIQAYVKYGAVFTFNGEQYLAKITSKKYPSVETQNFYNLESVSVQKIVDRGIHEAIGKGQPLDAIDTNNIAKLLADSNPENVSKVVDENGEPLVVYHGTDEWNPLSDETENGFDTIQRGRHRENTGAWFTASSDQAHMFGGNVVGCFLNIRNPYEIDADGASYEEIPSGYEARIFRNGVLIKDLKGEEWKHQFETKALAEDDAKKRLNDIEKVKELLFNPSDTIEVRVVPSLKHVDDAVRDGRYLSHDGAIINDIVDGDAGRGDYYITFSPSQVKSATDNIGTFDAQNNDIRYSIGSLYTGSAADYDSPSLHYVGTGEGAQVYGWGLYASNVEDVAFEYAYNDANRKESDFEIKIGENVYKRPSWDLVKNGKIVDAKSPEEYAALYFFSARGGENAYELINENIRKKEAFLAGDTSVMAPQESVEFLNEVRDIIEGIRNIELPATHIYEQTFFTNRPEGDESHLLLWHGEVTDEQRQWVMAQLEKEFTFGEGEEWLREVLDESKSGEQFYLALQDVLIEKLGVDPNREAPKAASEFLARAGIDGVKYPVNARSGGDGKGGWNYVSFRDDNIRVDHKWVDGEMRYSVGAATEAEFKADPNTSDWVVYVEPSYIRTMRSHALKDLKPVTESLDNNSVEKAIKNLFTEFGKVTNTAYDYTVVFNRADAGKMMMQSGVNMRTFAPQMKALFETAVHAFDNPQKMMAGHKFHKNVLGFKHFVNKFKDGEGKEYYVRFTVREEKGGRKGVHAATVSDVTVYEAKNAATVSANESEGQYRVFTDKILAKFLSKGNQHYSADVNENRFSVSARRPDLVGLHNMSAEGLKGADALGGFAMPSIAITRDSMGHNEFGDISLLMRTSAFDPKVNRQNKLYSRDAWTPTFPGIVNKANIKHIVDVSERLLGTLPDDVRKAIGHNETYRLLYEDGIQEKFTSSSTAGDAYGTNAALKAAYLVSKGETVEPVMKPRTFLDRSNNRILALGEDGLRLINETIGDMLVAFHSIPGAERIDWIDQHASEIEAAFIDAAYTSRIAKNPDVAEFTREEVIGHLFKKNPLGFADVIDLADAVAKLRKAIAKGEADAQTVDEYATKRAIDERVPNHDPTFEAWLNEQYGDPILARGIRNNKDYYTSSGKRRSWDALHDPVTLANVVKVMLSKQRAQGEGFLGANPFGLTAAKFTSFKDVIKNEDLLKELPKEEMDAIRDGFIQAFSEISARYSKTWKYHDNNPYTAIRQSDDALLDAWADSKGTIEGLKRELNGYGRTASDELIRDFMDVMNGIAKFPTKYFEAKPMRAVGFEEVAAAIIPDTASEETREILKRRGVPVYEYTAGNDTSRLAALNMAADDVEGTRFAVRSRVNPNQMDLFEDYLPDYAQRHQLDDKAQHEMKALAANAFKLSDESREIWRKALQFNSSDAWDKAWKTDEANFSKYPTVGRTVLESYSGNREFSADVRGLKIESAEDIALMMMALRSPYQEMMKAVYLDKDKRVLDARVLTIGISGRTVFSQQVVFGDMPEGTESVIVSHNHPSGYTEPSTDDISSTEKLNTAAETVGVTLLDHVITNGTSYYSLRDETNHKLSEDKRDRASWEVLPGVEQGNPMVTPSRIDEVVRLVRQHGDEVVLLGLDYRRAIEFVRLIPADVMLSDDDAASLERKREIVGYALKRMNVSSIVLYVPTQNAEDRDKFYEQKSQILKNVIPLEFAAANAGVPIMDVIIRDDTTSPAFYSMRSHQELMLPGPHRKSITRGESKYSVAARPSLEQLQVEHSAANARLAKAYSDRFAKTEQTLKKVKAASDMAHSIGSKMDMSGNRMSALAIEDVLERAERAMATRLLAAVADDEDRDITVGEAAKLIKAYGLSRANAMASTQTINRLRSNPNQAKGNTFISMAGEEVNRYNARERRAFTSGARRAVEEALTLSPQQEALKHELEMVTGIVPAQFIADNGFSVAESLLMIEDDEAKMTEEQIKLRIEKRKAAAKREEVEMRAAEGDANAEAELEANAVEELLSNDRIAKFKARQKQIKQGAEEIRNAMDKRDKNKTKHTPVDDGSKEHNGKSEEEDNEDDFEEALFKLLKERGLEFTDVRDLVAYIVQDVAQRYYDEHAEGFEKISDLAKYEVFLHELRKSLEAQLKAAARQLAYGFNRESVNREIQRLLQRRSFYGILSSAEKAFATLNAARIRQTRKETIREMIKMINAAIGKTQATATKAIEDRKVSGDLAMRLSYIRKILKMGDTALQQEIADLATLGQGLGGLVDEDYRKSAEYRMKRDVINIFGGARHMMPSELAMRRDELERDINGGRQEIEDLLAATQERINKIKNALALAIVQDAPDVIREMSKMEKGLDSVLGLFRLRLERLIDRSTGEVRERAMEAIEEIDFLMSQGADELTGQKSRDNNEANQIMIDCYGSLENARKRLSEELPHEVRAILSKQKTAMTRDHALFVYACLTQEDYENNMRKHGRMTDEYKQALLSVLNDQDLKFLNAMRKILADRFPAIQAEYKKLTGSTVYTTPNYFPFKAKLVKEDDAVGALNESQSWNPIIGEMTPRVRHGLDLDEHTTATGIFFERLDKCARMKAYGSRGVYITDILMSGTMANAIESAWGAEYHAKIKRVLLDTFVGVRGVNTNETNVMNTIATITALGQLSYNFSSALVQLSAGWIASAHELGFGEVLKNQLQVMFGLRGGEDVARAIKNLKESDWFAARYGAGVDINIREFVSGRGGNSLIAKFYKAGMQPIQIADWLTSINNAVAIYLKTEKALLDKGLSAEEAKARAVSAAGSHIERTQQSGRMHDQSEFARRVKFGRFLTLFSSAPMQLAQYEMRAFQKLKARQKGSVKGFVNAILINHVLVPALVGMARNIFKAIVGTGDDDDELTEEQLAKKEYEDAVTIAIDCILGPWSALPILGSLASVVANHTFGGPKYARTWSLSGASYIDRLTKDTFEMSRDIVQYIVSDPDNAPNWNEVVKEFNDVMRYLNLWKAADNATEKYTGQQIFEAMGVADDIDWKTIAKQRTKRTNARKRREKYERVYEE